ncbi:MAG TPA: carboxypeptidase-like regulatory domain-containing protein [Terriglobia bacterium]|nr:carboxypeptidase-like regulatory domain-containing protein [Terriglobia bacterium]
MKPLNYVRLVLICLVLPVALWAQGDTGSLSGTVTDPNGAAVPAAQVQATRVQTGTQYHVNTTAAGLYVFPNLPTGAYELRVKQRGFKTFVQTGIDLRLGLHERVNVQLALGSLQQTVEVTSAAPVLDTANATESTGLSPQTLATLPLWNGGLETANSFVGWMPGVNSNGETSINGSVGRASEILVDGASMVIPESGGVNFTFPGFYAFSEMRLVTSGFNAEYGRVGGGIQEYVTKSGTNQIHGGGFFNWKRDIFDAVPWSVNQNPGARLPGQAKAFRPKERFNEEGGYIGGPVYLPHIYDGRNKTFWYFTYASISQPSSISTNSGETVPTPAMKSGDFSALLNLPQPVVIYDPATTVNGVRQPFAGNIIPSGRFSAISNKILSFIPAPNSGPVGALTSNFTYNSQSLNTDKVWSVQIDHSIGTRNHLTFFMTHRSAESSTNQYFPGPLSNGLNSFNAPYHFRGSDDFILTPHLLLHTIFGYSEERQFWQNPLQNGFGTKIGLPLQAGTPQDAMPIIAFENDLTMPTGGYIPGFTSWGMNQGKVNSGGQWNKTIEFAQTLDWIRGKHEFKTGWDYRYLETNANDWAGTNGVYEFSGIQTAQSAGAAGGNAFASFLLGAVDFGSQNALPVFTPRIRYQYTSGFFQDTWRVRPTFTLNLGVRYEVPIGWHILDGDYSSFSPTAPNPAAGGLPGAMIFMGSGPGRIGALRPYPTDYHDVGPRLGFAWNLRPSMVIRGYYGIYYEALGNGGCGCTSGFGGGSFSQASDGFNPAFNWDPGALNPNQPAGNPGGVQPPPSFTPARQLPGVNNFNGSIYYLGPHYGTAPRIDSWNLTVEKEYKNWLFDLGYIGNRGHGLSSSVFINTLPTSDLFLGNVQTPNGTENLLQANLQGPLAADICTYTSAISCTNGIPDLPFPSFMQWGGGATLAQALRPYPQYGTVYSANSGDGQSWYDSFQAKVEHRFGDLNFMGAYVWSKTLDTLSYRQIFTQTTQQGAQDSYDLRDAKSYMIEDIPNYLNIIISYRLPFGRGKRFLGAAPGIVDEILGGWTFAADQQYRSGTLIELLNPTNYLGQELFSTLTKVTATGLPARTGVSSTSLDPNNPSSYWFNHGANAPFAVTPPFTLGNGSIYNTHFRNPWYRWEAFSLNKRFPIRESVALNYQINVFNPFNRTDFGGIQGNLNSPNFGRPTGAMVGPRNITMGLRIEF